MAQTLSNKPFSEKDVSQAWQAIQNAQKITLLTHQRPDGDGISACAALSLICKKMGKDVEAVYPSEPEFEIKRQPANVLINAHIQTPDLLIVCDTANVERMYYPEEFKSIPIINIDHHISNNIKGTYNLVDAQSSSACELLTELIITWDKEAIDTPVAECLLVGILYDTQVFQIPYTTSQTLRLAAELVDKGANMHQIKTELLSHKNPAIISLWATLMKNVKVIPEKETALSVVTQDDLQKANLTLTSLVGFSNFLAQITDIDTTILLYETKTGQIKGSFRSKKRDVNALAAQFGGGGHIHASGIQSDMTIEKLVEELNAKL